MITADQVTVALVETLSQHSNRGRREVEEGEEDAFLLGFKGYFYPLPALLHLK